MSIHQSSKEDCVNSLHQNAERISEFIDLTSSHRFLASYGTGSVTVQQTGGEELKSKITTVQIQIVEKAFEIMKILLPALKKVNKDKIDQIDGELKTALELQWTDFAAALEMFSRDLKILFRINSVTANHSVPTWNGIRNGVHTKPGVFDLKAATPSKERTKEGNKPPASRMEDSLRKMEMILHALHTQIAVHAWTVQNFSSFKMESMCIQKQTQIKNSMLNILRTKHAAAVIIFIITGALVLALMQSGII